MTGNNSASSKYVSVRKQPGGPVEFDLLSPLFTEMSGKTINLVSPENNIDLKITITENGPGARNVINYNRTGGTNTGGTTMPSAHK